MTMDIESLAITLTEGAAQNFEEFGGISTVTFFIMNGSITPLPQQLMDILTQDRERFYAVVRELVKKHNPDAVAMICEAWFVDDLSGKLEQPSKSPKKKECVFVTVDSKDRQVSYIAEIRDRKLCEWKQHPVYEKNSGGSTAMSGNMIDFYGTGRVLNLPMGMYEKPQGSGTVEKVD
jgi:hypothetical protein